MSCWLSQERELDLAWCYLGLQERTAPGSSWDTGQGALRVGTIGLSCPRKNIRILQGEEEWEVNRESKTLSMEFPLNRKIDSHPTSQQKWLLES